MTAILPTPAYADTPGRDTPYPPSDEYLPTGRTPLADYLTFFWLPGACPAGRRAPAATAPGRSTPSWSPP